MFPGNPKIKRKIYMNIVVLKSLWLQIANGKRWLCVVHDMPDGTPGVCETIKIKYFYLCNRNCLSLQSCKVPRGIVVS